MKKALLRRVFRKQAKTAYGRDITQYYLIKHGQEQFKRLVERGIKIPVALS